MPRKTRKELTLEDEDQQREEREESYRRLGIELRRAWQEQQVPPAPSR